MRSFRASMLVLVLAGCDGVTFTLEPSHERCVSETIPERSLLTGDWKIGGGTDDDSNTQVRAPDGTVLFENKHASGHFSVTAAAAGQHHICVRNEGTEAREVGLNVKQAVEVDDHNVIAKQEHVEAIEAELDRMKKMATHVYEEMVYMRDRSDAMHTTSESTRARLLWVRARLSNDPHRPTPGPALALRTDSEITATTQVEGVMMCTLLFMGLWQIHYLKRYFQTKKII